MRRGEENMAFWLLAREPARLTPSVVVTEEG